MNNRLIVPAGVLMAAVLIIAGGYVILTEDKQSDKKPAEPSGVKEDKPAEISENNSINQNDSGNNNSDENPYVEKTTEDISPEKIREMVNEVATNNNLTQNTKPQFGVGDRYVYKVTEKPRNLVDDDETQTKILKEAFTYNLEINVVGKIRVNKNDYFKIQMNMGRYVMGTMYCKAEIRGTYPCKKGEQVELIVPPHNMTRYITIDTGEMFEGVETGNPKKIDEGAVPYQFYAPWMLAIGDDLKWRHLTLELSSYDREYFGGEYEDRVIDFSVKGREKIGGRECFVVNNEYKVCSKSGNCKITHKYIFYIDVEKRVLLKFEAWEEGNLNMGDTVLTEQNVWKTNS